MQKKLKELLSHRETKDTKISIRLVLSDYIWMIENDIVFQKVFELGLAEIRLDKEKRIWAKKV